MQLSASAMPLLEIDAAAFAALPSFMTPDAAITKTAPPESADDADYVKEVLGQPEGVTEFELDERLMTLAARLGVALPEPRRSITAEYSKVSTPAEEIVNPLQHARTSSTSNPKTTIADLATSNHPAAPGSNINNNGLARIRSRSINFGSYDKYLGTTDISANQSRFKDATPSNTASRPNMFRANSKRGIREFRRSFTGILLKRKSLPTPVDTILCVCCREELIKGSDGLEVLPCGHTYCHPCLAVVVRQAMSDEAKMPPRCCTQAFPSSVIKTVLTREEQVSFLKAVAQYSTPWAARIFCPDTACGQFIPPRSRVDPKHPFQVVCRHCKARVCIMCKRPAHRLGQDCPEDAELESVLQMGEQSGWRRCYKCRALVELSQGCTHMTCRCKAQFCYICGGVWDNLVGCPNFCSGEEELERRRMEEEARLLELEAENEAQKAAAAAEEAELQEMETRTRQNQACADLQVQQLAELARFQTYERKRKQAMWDSHAQQRQNLVDRYTEVGEKMRERHAKTEQHLEDRQIEAEMELRTSLAQSEKSIHIQLKYMEAFCNGTGRFADVGMPAREVTQKHLEQLGQQYHIRDGLERRHQSQINVLREKQAKRMEGLVARHREEWLGLEDKREKEIEDLALEFANEEEELMGIFRQRKVNLVRRWQLCGQILRKKLEKLHGQRFASVPLPVWPSATDLQQDTTSTNALPIVTE